MKKKIIFFVGGTILLAVTATLIIYFVSQDEMFKPEDGKEKQTGCLGESEIAGYELIDEKDEQDKAIIIVSDKETLKENHRFEINILSATHYHPIELHKCGVYAAKSSNYDYTIRKPLAGYTAEIWKYDYRGEKKWWYC